MSALIWKIPAGGGEVNINFAQLLGLFIAAAGIMWAVYKRYDIPFLYTDKLSLLLYGYLVSNIFSSLFFSSQPAKALKSCIVILVYINIYQVMRWLIQKGDETASIRWLKVVSFASCIFGFTAMIASLVLGGWENIGVSLGHISENAPSIRSLSYEPNVFAIITSVIVCLNIASYIMLPESDVKDLGIILFISLCILFAYTRSAYASLTLAFLIMLGVSGKITIKTMRYAIVGIVVIGALGIMLSSDNFLKQAVLTRTVNIGNFEEGSGVGRVATFMLGWSGFVRSPVFGNGTMMAETADVNMFGELQELMGSPGWLSGSFIQSLHDTGIVGALIILTFFVSIIRANYSCYKNEENKVRKSIFLGFMSGNIVLAIASQITSVLWIGFPFVYWAINISMISYSKRQIEIINTN